MLPFLHKYIASNSTRPPSHHHRNHHGRRCTDHSAPKQSITSSCDTFESRNSVIISHSNLNTNDEHKYNEDVLPSTSESKVILIETDNDNLTDPESIKSSDKSRKSFSSKNDKKRTKRKHMRYWTVSIASKHDNISITDKVTMGFGICDIKNSGSFNDIDTDQASKLSAYGYEHYDDQIYVKLKSMDDILIAFNTKSKKLTLWQNGKRFNQMFVLCPSKLYAFGIKLYGDDYSIKILPNTGN